MGFLGRKINTNRVQKEIQAALQEAAQSLPVDTSFEEDRAAFQNSYAKHGYDYSVQLFDQILQKWDLRLTKKGRANLCRIMGGIAVLDNRFDQGQTYYDQALAYMPNNHSIMIDKAEGFMAQGDLAQAREYFRQAFHAKQDIHTSAKYAELLFLTGEQLTNIAPFVKPFLGQVVSTFEPKRSEAIILALHLMALESPAEQASQYEYIVKHNSFKNPSLVLGKITDVVQLWNGLDRDLAAKSIATQKASSRFNVSVSSVSAQPCQIKADEIDSLTAAILRAYRSATDIFTDPFDRRPASREVVRAAGGRGPNWC